MLTVDSVAIADFRNLAPVASSNNNLIVFGDYPSKAFPPAFGVAWEDSRRRGYVAVLLPNKDTTVGSQLGIVSNAHR